MINFDNLDQDALDLLYGFDADEYRDVHDLLDDFGYSSDDAYRDEY